MNTTSLTYGETVLLFEGEHDELFARKIGE